MKRYLICSPDESVTNWPPRSVFAATADDALNKYLHMPWFPVVAFGLVAAYSVGLLADCEQPFCVNIAKQ